MKNTKSKIIVLLCVALFIMVIGYGAFSTSLTITGTANIASEWKVVFTDITQVSKTSGVNIKSTPVASGTSATFDVGLTNPGDKIEYKITVENQGNIDAIIEDIRISETGNDAIIFNVANIEIGDTLLGKTSTTFNVTIEYNPNVTSQPSNLTNTLTVSVDYVQHVGGSSGGSSTSVIFNKETPNDLTFTSEEDVSTFQEVRVDNEVVDSSNYTVTSGSTIITLNKEYLQTLTVGTHTMDIVSTTGTTSTTFEVSTTKSSMNLVEKILSDNEVYADNVKSTYVSRSTGIDFSKISSDTNGKGLYYTSTNTENNLSTYYFRGAVTNNYVKFGKDSSGNDILWRIVRINEDGSIRMITEDIVGDSEFNAPRYVLVNNNTEDYMSVGYMYGYPASFNASSDDPVCLEYSGRSNGYDQWFFTSGEMIKFCNQTGGTLVYEAYDHTHSNLVNSTIKDYLDTWYETNLSNYSDYLADAGFCNDRSVDGNTQQFKCPITSDLFTTSASSKGNKALTYPIGLLTADEVAYAGAALNQTNESMYLTDGSWFWTMSPVSLSTAQSWVYVLAEGELYPDNYTYDAYDVRPVINLKSTVTLSSTLPSGCSAMNGTSSCPYIINTN